MYMSGSNSFSTKVLIPCYTMHEFNGVLVVSKLLVFELTLIGDSLIREKRMTWKKNPILSEFHCVLLNSKIKQEWHIVEDGG